LQPNPVGLLWDGGDTTVTCSQTDARRLANIRRQPLCSLNFDSNGGDDIVVLTGTAEILDDYPAVCTTGAHHNNLAWGTKLPGSRAD
jgi:hypothetical protein